MNNYYSICNVPRHISLKREPREYLNKECKFIKCTKSGLYAVLVIEFNEIISIPKYSLYQNKASIV